MNSTDSDTRQTPEPDGEVDVLALIAKVRVWTGIARRRRNLLYLPVLVAILCGLFLALGSTQEFQAFTKLVPYSSTGVSASSLSGLAGLAGIRLPAGGAGELTITSDLYPEVASTLDFVIAVAETPIAFSGHDSLRTAVRYFSEEFRPSPVSLLASATIGLPGQLRKLVANLSAKDSARTPVRAAEVRQLDQEYREIVDEIRDRLTVMYDKRTGVITVVATMPDPLAAADLVRASADRLTQFVIEHEVQKVDGQLVFIEQQYIEARARYEAADRALASFVDRNRVLITATAQLERTRLEREVEVSYEVFQQFVREREQARIKRSQDAPVFTVLEQATVPNQRSSPRRSVTMVVALVFGLFAGVLRIVWSEICGAQSTELATS